MDLKAGDKIVEQAVADVRTLRDAIRKAPKETQVLVQREGKDVAFP